MERCILDERDALTALLSACALCDRALPEREAHPEIFHGLKALFQSMDQEIWAAAYVMWEVALLRELGFALDLSKCAGGGDPETLAFISPKTGRAVSMKEGAPYKEKLLHLPEFLKPGAKDMQKIGTREDVYTGLKMTGYFLENWVFAQHSKGIPPSRLRLEALFANKEGNIST